MEVVEPAQKRLYPEVAEVVLDRLIYAVEDQRALRSRPLSSLLVDLEVLEAQLLELHLVQVEARDYLPSDIYTDRTHRLEAFL